MCLDLQVLVGHSGGLRRPLRSPIALLEGTSARVPNPSVRAFDSPTAPGRVRARVPQPVAENMSWQRRFWQVSVERGVGSGRHPCPHPGATTGNSSRHDSDGIAPWIHSTLFERLEEQTSVRSYASMRPAGPLLAQCRQARIGSVIARPVPASVAGPVPALVPQNSLGRSSGHVLGVSSLNHAPGW